MKKSKKVIGIGASAGGLEACKQLLSGAPEDTGFSFVIIMHLAPQEVSHIAEIFQSSTEMPVIQVKEKQSLKANHVYVIAPATSLEVSEGGLIIDHRDDPEGVRTQIDTFLTSLAKDQKTKAVGIILSGTGGDGTKGLNAIKSQGGICLVQDPETAEYDSMPRSALASENIDAVLSPEDMISYLSQSGHVSQSKRHIEGFKEEEEESPFISGYQEVLKLLGKTYGVSFSSNYKGGTLERRMRRRMNLKQVNEFKGYLEYLQNHPDEVASLYSDLLIGVTKFFRDPQAWETLKNDFIPKIFQDRDKNSPIRVWVPGCASGEEAYTVAILILEEMDRLNLSNQLQVFATDIAKKSLENARRGVYPLSIREDISEKYLTKYFKQEGENFKILQPVRDMITFAPHNLLVDPPFTNIDLISCRNVLIYMKGHAQLKILERFHFALKQGGMLFLGPSETTGQQEKLFNSLSQKAKVFTPLTNKPIRYNYITRDKSDKGETGEKDAQTQYIPDQIIPPKSKKLDSYVEQFVLKNHTKACVAITESFEIHSFFGPINNYLKHPTGEARLNLMSWAKPGLFPRLRSALEQAKKDKKRVIISHIHVERENTSIQIECNVEPIIPLPQGVQMYLVSFRDLPQAPSRTEKNHEVEGGSDRQRIEELEAELKNTQEELQGTIQQLENTNEEYQAGHEELLSLNEELQSSNEELEASKEELQSLNEELTTVNQQLRQKNQDLRDMGNDLNNLLISTKIPIIFLNRDNTIRRFTPMATEIMYLTQSDLGRSIEHIKSKVKDGGLVNDTEKVLKELIPITTEIETEDGTYYKREVLPYRTDDDRIDGTCITFYDITGQKLATQKSEQARLFAQAIVDTSVTSLLVLDEDMKVVSVNDSFCENFQVPKAETENKTIFEIGNYQWDIPKLRRLLEKILPNTEEVKNFEVTHQFEHIGSRTMLLNARRIRYIERPLILLGIEDITEQKEAEEEIREQADQLSKSNQRKNEFLSMLSHELRNPLSALMNGLELIKVQIDEPEKLTTTHEMMVRQAKRIIYLLDELLEVSRLTTGKIQLKWDVIDLIEIVQSAIEAVEPRIKSNGQKLSVNLPEKESVLIEGDEARLTQVIENLLTNSSKYTPEGRRIWISLEKEGDQAKVTVNDEGEGIESDLLPHIFEIFTQGKRTLERSSGGMGLGLPLSKSLTEKHGGSISANSPGPGKGSSFIVKFPLTTKSKKREETSSRPAKASTSEGAPERILLVDDEKEAAMAIKALLESENYQVEIASEGHEALNMAKEFDPQVIFLDLGLPSLNGYELAKQWRQDSQHQKTFIVAMTGYEKNEQKLAEAGINDHMIKPLDKDHLFKMLNKIVIQ